MLVNQERNELLLRDSFFKDAKGKKRTVLLDDVDGEVGGGEDVAVVGVVAVVVEQRVKSFLLNQKTGIQL